MADQFLSEIRQFSFGFPPQGWAMCDGQLLPINQNPALFSLLGTTYGGDGRVNFALPDLRARVPIHTGNGHTLGEWAGEAAHTLTAAELPVHTHQVLASSGAGTTPVPTGTYLAAAANLYGDAAANPVADVAMAGSAGGSQAHLNMQPFLTLNFCIALQGNFPSQN